jgi:hypothetical protein
LDPVHQALRIEEMANFVVALEAMMNSGAKRATRRSAIRSAPENDAGSAAASSKARRNSC